MNKLKILLAIAAIVVATSCHDEDESVLTNISTQKANPSVNDNTGTQSFSTPQTYACTNVLIDASRDGGVWWYPQAGAFDAKQDHQGKRFAELLRSQGFRVDEMPRGEKITDDILRNYAVIIRAEGSEYSSSEIEAYHKKMNEGITLFLLGDHHKFGHRDLLAESLDVNFSGVVEGKVSKLESDPFTSNVSDLNYMVGSVISNPNNNPNILPIGWLTDGSLVMARYKHAKSAVFVMGDVNTVEFFPEPFVENLVKSTRKLCMNE